MNSSIRQRAGLSIREARAYLKVENRKFTARLEPLPRAAWEILAANQSRQVLAVYRSNRFLVTAYAEQAGLVRLSICRTELKPGTDEWMDGITWDEIWAIKHECGYGDWYGVEVYPRSIDLVNVSSMRHLWLMKEPLSIGWQNGMMRL